jgi:hypothetical protein
MPRKAYVDSKNESSSSQPTGNVGFDKVVSAVSKKSPLLGDILRKNYNRNKSSGGKKRSSGGKKRSSSSSSSGGKKRSSSSSSSNAVNNDQKVSTSTNILPDQKPENVSQNAWDTLVALNRSGNIPSIYGEGMPLEDQKPSGVVTGVPSSTRKIIENAPASPFKDIDSIKKSDSKKKDTSGIKMSPYLEKFGYMPYDPDYYAISSDITGKKEQITTGMKDIITGSPQAFQYNRQMIDDIKMIQNAPSGSTFTIGEQSDLSKKEALELISNQILKNINVMKQVTRLPSLDSKLKRLINLENTVGEYKRKGYTVDIKTDDKGNITDYEFGLPKASDVHSWYWNDPELEKIALTSAAFMESPLAIGTLIDAGAGAITGDKKWGERRLEKLSEFSLGLSEKLKDDDYLGYTINVGSSPAMVQGVYIPLATMGAGYAISGITAGATGASVLSRTGSTVGKTLYNVGARGGTKLSTGLKVGMGAFGGVMLGKGAVDVASGLQSGQISGYDLPSMAGEVAFSVGMGYGGYKTGQRMWHSRHPLVKKIDITGETDILQTKTMLEGGKNAGHKFDFELWSKQTVGDQPVNVEMTGGGKYFPKSETSISYGKGWMQYNKKGSWFKRKFGIGKEESWWHKFEVDPASATKRNTIGDFTYSNYAGKSVLSAGKKGNYGYGKLGFEPVSSKGTVISRQVGNAKFYDSMGNTKMFPNVEHHGFMSSGDWMGNFMKGSNVQVGNLYQINPKVSGGGGAGIGQSGGGGGMISVSKSGSGGLTGILGNLDFQGGSLADVLGQMSAHVVDLHSGGAGASAGASAGAGVGAGGLGMTLRGAGGSSMSIQQPEMVNVAQASAEPVSISQPSSMGVNLVSALKSSGQSAGLSLAGGGAGASAGGGAGASAGGGISLSKVVNQQSSKQDNSVMIDVGQTVGQGQGLKLGQRGRKGLGLLQIGALSPKTEIDYDQKSFTGELFSPAQQPVFDLGQDEAEEYKPMTGTVSLTGLASDQTQRLKMGKVSLTESVFADPISVIPVSPVNPIKPIIPPPLIGGGGGKGDSSAMSSRHWQWGGGKKGERVLVKTVLADPFFVQYSQVHFGKATHLVPDKETWELGEKTGWRLPTKEIKMAGGIGGIMKKGGEMKLSLGKIKLGGSNKNTKISLNVLGR